MLFLNCNNFAQVSAKYIKKEINEILHDDYFNSTDISIDVFDLTANKSLIKLNNKFLLHPASNEKILTSAAAFLLSKENFKFTTNFYYTGDISDSVIDGDVFVTGTGDPDFDSAELDSLILKIKQNGINEITGNLYGDVSFYDSLYWGNGWMWDDDPSSDVPYLTPLVINNSAVKIAVKPTLIGRKVDAKLIPQNNFLKIINNALTVDADTSKLKVSRKWILRDNTITINGTLSNSFEPDTFEVNIYKPEIYFLKLVRQSFAKHRIKLRGKIGVKTLPDSAKLLIQFERNAKDVIQNMNKESDNLSAESLLRLLGFQYFGKPATAENGIIVIDSLITVIGFNPDDYRIVDGSGLSHYNLITTELVSRLLRYLYNQKYDIFNLIYSSFPIAGVDGTLEERMTDGLAFNNVHAKTGTLSGISALSGYLTAKNNDLIAFSIFIQNFVGKGEKAKKIEDRICELLSGMTGIEREKTSGQK